MRLHNLSDMRRACYHLLQTTCGSCVVPLAEEGTIYQDIVKATIDITTRGFPWPLMEVLELLCLYLCRLYFLQQEAPQTTHKQSPTHVCHDTATVRSHIQYDMQHPSCKGTL